MDIRINHLVIHELEKEAGSPEAQVFLAKRLLPAGEQETALVRRLNHAFVRNEEVLQGFLSPAGEALFPTFFHQMAEAAFTGEAFLRFTKDAMNALLIALQGIIGVKGGYLVFADYEEAEDRLIGIFLVRDAEGLIFRKDQAGETFEVAATTYVNTQRLALASRIHVARFREGRDRYVELIKYARSQKEISEYFLHWIGLERPESNKDLTTTFLQVLDELPLPVDMETGEVMEEDRFRSEVFNFAMTSPQKTIRIAAFDEHFYGEEPRTRQFLEENQLELDQEFRFDRGLIRQLHHFRLSAEGIILSFTRDDYRSGKISLEGDALIIHSPDLAAELRALLE